MYIFFPSAGCICLFKVMKPIVVYKFSVNVSLGNYFMPIQLFIWRLSSKLPITIPVHSVIYAATFFS